MTIKAVLWAGMFAKENTQETFPYVVAVHQVLGTLTHPPGVSGLASVRWISAPRHHYVDGSASTLITDANCPHGASVTKAASHIFSTGAAGVVRFCAVGKARDWTTDGDAGFLSVSQHQDTTADPTAVGTFEDALVVMFAEGSQVWDVAVDPSATQFRKRMSGVGTPHPQSLASFYKDLVFASPFGVRSMSVQEAVERIDETDVGVPIDELVAEAQEVHESISDRPVIAAWIPQLGQYWLVYAQSLTSSRVFAYSFSRSSKLAAWSEYTFPIAITGIATLAGKVYLRDATSLYELDKTAYTDNGAPIDVDVQMAYQDAKLPGVEKQFYGADFVFTGTPSVSYLYDPTDQDKETNSYPVSGDTRVKTMVPVEVCSAALAPRFQHSADEAFSLDLITIYFHALGAMI